MRSLVVTPTHNRPDMLAECIESASVRPPDCRHVVVDDASDPPATVPGSVHLVRLDAPAKGPSAARNAGIDSFPDADVIIDLDDDDLIAPGAIDRILATFADERVEYVYGWCRVSNIRGKTALVKKKPYRLGAFKVESQGEQYGIRAYRRETWERVGGFRERYAGDLAFALRVEASAQERSICCLPVVLGKVRRDPDGISCRHWPEQIETANVVMDLARQGKL